MKRRSRAGDRRRSRRARCWIRISWLGRGRKASSSTQPIHETRQEQLIFCNKTVCLSDVRRALR